MDGRPEQVTEREATASASATGHVEAAPSATAPERQPAIASAPRQRWRLVLARDASDGALSGRGLAEAWDAAIDASGLPVYRGAGRPKPRIQFGAPVPASIALEHELADVALAQLVPRWRVREAIEAVMPAGWRLLDVFDVWPGEQPLPGQVAAADHRIDVDGADANALRDAAARLLAVRSLPRVRPRGDETVRYDLRPLLANVEVADDGPPPVLRVRTRFDPSLGTGRPEEVVAALGEASRCPLQVRAIVRERVLTAADLDVRE